jgi:poly-beta-1,6-N-acetyl-D-glucosamine synthase
VSYKYAIATPVKNEEAFLGRTIASVVSQKIRPQKWVIVNDASTDRTGELIRTAAAEHPWIVHIERVDDHQPRKPGGESVVAVGIRHLNIEDFDFFVRMDGDISFDSDYFARIFEFFEKDPKLGIASGVCYVPDGDRLKEEQHPRFHTRGPIKTYRVPCFQEIGGLETGLGFDTVDEITAHMHGWKTYSFPELKVIHHRKTQTARGPLRGMLNLGRASYYLGYHPLYLTLRVVKHLTQPPYVLGGLYMLAGYLNGYRKKQDRKDQEFIKYLRKQQINKLTGRSTIWK